MIYSKHIANINVRGEKPKTFPIKLETRQGSPLSPFLFNIEVEILARSILQLKEIKVIQIGQKELKLSLFVEDMILYIKDCKNVMRQLLQMKNTITKVAGYKINT